MKTEFHSHPQGESPEGWRRGDGGGGKLALLVLYLRRNSISVLLGCHLSGTLMDQHSICLGKWKHKLQFSWRLPSNWFYIPFLEPTLYSLATRPLRLQTSRWRETMMVQSKQDNSCNAAGLELSQRRETRETEITGPPPSYHHSACLNWGAEHRGRWESRGAHVMHQHVHLEVNNGHYSQFFVVYSER